MPQCKYFFVCCFSLLFYNANAQLGSYTEAEAALDSAVHTYNAMRSYADNLSATNITDAEVDYIEEQKNLTKAQLSRVIRIGTSTNIDVANYFMLLSDYEYGFTCAVANKLSESFRILEAIKPKMLALNPSQFNKNYKFENKNYSITWENVAPTLLEYYALMAELYTAEKNYSASREFAKYALNSNYTSEPEHKNWLKYLSINQYINATTQLRYYTYDDALMAIEQIKYFQSLDTSYKNTIIESGISGYVSGYNYILNLKSNNPQVTSLKEIYAQTAAALKNVKDYERAAVMYNNALNEGYYSETFIQEIFGVADIANNNTLGAAATEKWQQNIMNSDCAAWRQVAYRWNIYGNNQKSSAATDQAENCENIAAETQRAYEKEQARQQRVADRNFSVYAGIYPLPMIIRYNKYRDYGGVVGFGIRNFSMEFSYKKINLNHVVYDEFYFKDIETEGFENYWDGYRAHVAFKFGERDSYSDGFFVGPLFEMVKRNYLSTKSQVFDANGLTYLYETSFVPVETSYNLMLNMGGRVEENHFMAEYFMGIGVAYHLFDGGGEEFDNDDYFLSNPVIQNREPERFGPVVRFGMTFGLSTKK